MDFDVMYKATELRKKKYINIYGVKDVYENKNKEVARGIIVFSVVSLGQKPTKISLQKIKASNQINDNKTN